MTGGNNSCNKSTPWSTIVNTGDKTPPVDPTVAAKQAAEKARQLALQQASQRASRNRTSFAGELGNSGYVKRPSATLLGGS
jgi:hypothetical protein